MPLDSALTILVSSVKLYHTSQHKRAYQHVYDIVEEVEASETYEHACIVLVQPGEHHDYEAYAQAVTQEQQLPYLHSVAQVAEAQAAWHLQHIPNEKEQLYQGFSMCLGVFVSGVFPAFIGDDQEGAEERADQGGELAAEGTTHGYCEGRVGL